MSVCVCVCVCVCVAGAKSKHSFEDLMISLVVGLVLIYTVLCNMARYSIVNSFDGI